jgi:hypothetical protein
VTVHSNTASPTPAKSRSSAFCPNGPPLAGRDLLLPFMLVGLNVRFGSCDGEVGSEGLLWCVGLSLCQETFAKSSLSLSMVWGGRKDADGGVGTVWFLLHFECGQ